MSMIFRSIHQNKKWCLWTCPLLGSVQHDTLFGTKKYSVSKGPFVYNSKTSPTCGEKLSPPMDVAEKLPLYYEVAASEKIQAV